MAPVRASHFRRDHSSENGDLRRFSRGAILASFAMAALGAAFALRGNTADPVTGSPRSQVAEAASNPAANPVAVPITSTDELLVAIGKRRELASLPIISADPSLTTSSQQWADGLAARGVGHDPAILDGITDDWQQVAELVSAGPSFEAASRMLLTKAAGTSPLDDAKVTSVGIGTRVEGATTFVVVRLLRLPPSGDVNVQMGF